MQISGISSQNDVKVGGNKAPSDDSIIKNARQQIEDLKRQIKELAENDKMDAKTKSEKKQELQKQINELNVRIRQREMELRKQQQEAKENPQREEAKAAAENAVKPEKVGFSKEMTGAVVAASTHLDVAGAMSEVSAKLSGRAGELETEIATDIGRGAATSAKENELFKVKNGAKNSADAAVSGLAEAGEKLENAAEADKESDSVDEKEDSEEENEVRTDGMYDKDGNRVEDENENVGDEYEDRA